MSWNPTASTLKSKGGDRYENFEESLSLIADFLIQSGAQIYDSEEWRITEIVGMGLDKQGFSAIICFVQSTITTWEAE